MTIILKSSVRGFSAGHFSRSLHGKSFVFKVLTFGTYSQRPSQMNRRPIDERTEYVRNDDTTDHGQNMQT